MSKECGSPFVAFFDANVVISPSYVEFCEKGASAESVDYLWYKWGDISVLLRPFVQWSIILYRTKFSIFLFDKKEICCIWSPRWTYCSSSEVFGDEFVGFFFFYLC